MIISGNEYRPRYLVRMLGRLYNELILRNVFSIRSGIFVDNIDGYFEIILDNQNSIADKYGLYHLIQPMDYIEIFYSRDLDAFIPPSEADIAQSLSVSATNITTAISPTTKNTPSQIIANQLQAIAQWGYVDVSGNFNPAVPATAGADGTYQLFTRDSTTGEIVSNGSLGANYQKLIYNSVDSTSSTTLQSRPIARPLSPAEKVNTPTFGFCGLVDTVTDTFAMGPNGQVFPTLTISGRSMGKVLTTHEVFTSSILFNPTIPLQVLSAYGAHPSRAIQEILNIFLLQMIQLLFNTATNAAANTSTIKSLLYGYALNAMTLNLPLANTGTSQPYSINFPVYVRNFVGDALNYTVQGETDGNPVDGNYAVGIPFSSVNIAATTTASSSDNSASLNANYLGRLMSDKTGVNAQQVFNISNFSDGPIITSLRQMCNDFLNELWVDECGRVVLRRIEDAWFQPIFNTQSVQGNTAAVDVDTGLENIQQLPVYTLDSLGNAVPQMIDANTSSGYLTPSKYVVYAKDIISWQLNKSDDNMATLVMVQDMYNMTGFSNLTLLAGIAPLTTEGRISAIQDAVGELMTVITGLISGQITDAQAVEVKNLQNNLLMAVSSGGSTQNAFNQLQQYITSLVSPGNQQALQSISLAFQGITAYTNGTQNLLAQPQSIWSFNLTNDQDVINFWQTFLMRPKVIPSVFATDTSSALAQAEIYFQQYSAMLTSGTITVKGNPRYKAGSRLYFEHLNADFYVDGVENIFPWGDGPYTTVLHVERGVFHGKTGGFYPPGVFSSTTVDSATESAAAGTQNIVNGG